MKKKIFAIVLCLIMAVALAIPAFATQSNVARAPVVGIPYFLACWNGQRDASGNMMVLRGNGMNATMTTNIMSDKGAWQYLAAPHGNMYLRNTASPQEVVNIYRVLQAGIYYECKGYWYDHSTSGRDQRIAVNGAQVYLANPLVSGTWYLQADRSALSVSSVIFFRTEPEHKHNGTGETLDITNRDYDTGGCDAASRI